MRSRDLGGAHAPTAPPPGYAYVSVSDTHTSPSATPLWPWLPELMAHCAQAILHKVHDRHIDSQRVYIGFPRVGDCRAIL